MDLRNSKFNPPRHHRIFIPTNNVPMHYFVLMRCITNLRCRYAAKKRQCMPVIIRTYQTKNALLCSTITLLSGIISGFYTEVQIFKPREKYLKRNFKSFGQPKH